MSVRVDDEEKKKKVGGREEEVGRWREARSVFMYWGAKVPGRLSDGLLTRQTPPEKVK